MAVFSAMDEITSLGIVRASYIRTTALVCVGKQATQNTASADAMPEF